MFAFTHVFLQRKKRKSWFPKDIVQCLTFFDLFSIQLNLWCFWEIKDFMSLHVPKSKTFRFENHLLLDRDFLPSVMHRWPQQLNMNDPAACLAAKLKQTRSIIKVWMKEHRKRSSLNEDCKFTIDLLDCIEELRPLNDGERCLRNLVLEKLFQAIQSKVEYWKQRG